MRPSRPFAAVSILFLALGSRASGQGLPPVPVPPENPITPAKAVLGKILFWDEQLSSDNTVACGTCHIPSAGSSDPRSFLPPSIHPGLDGLFGTPDDVRGSMGVVRCEPGGGLSDDGVFFPNRGVTGRKAQNAIASPWSPSIFWDGRAEGPFVNPDTGLASIPSGGALEIQALAPIVSDVEMACATRTPAGVAAKVAASKPLRLATNLPSDVQAALAADPTYPDLFETAFGSPGVTAERIAFAIATYERILVPDQTPWDLFAAGNPTALTPDQVAGLNLFLAPPPAGAGCAACHAPPLFTNQTFRNIGVRPWPEDPGRMNVTGSFADRGKFKVPSLRNVGLRAPFFHNGGVPSLTLVVGFYNGGGNFPDNQDPLINLLGLTLLERNQIVDFLQNALTDPRVAAGLPPFDRPTLHAEAFPANPLVYGPPSLGSGGVAPFVVAFAPPNLGNPAFTIGVGRGLGGAPALLAFSDQPAPPGLFLFGIPIHVDLVPAPTIVPFALAGSGPGEGYASLTAAIPDEPALLGASLFTQWFVVDAAAIGGLAASRGAALTLFGP
ncbi:MAG TPA: cytochrome c peroxidase [Planctomycetota bacterium]|jgi:cytochrome c peroxidase|nr:cytochrome c peroxidase [Planctomycetota bacterium]